MLGIAHIYRTAPRRVCFTYYAMHNRYNYSIYFAVVKYFGKIILKFLYQKSTVKYANTAPSAHRAPRHSPTTALFFQQPVFPVFGGAFVEGFAHFAYGAGDITVTGGKLPVRSFQER